MISPVESSLPSFTWPKCPGCLLVSGSSQGAATHAPGIRDVSADSLGKRGPRKVRRYRRWRKLSLSCGSLGNTIDLLRFDPHNTAAQHIG